MARSMDVEVSIPANSQNENVLSAQLFRTAPVSGFMRILETGSAAGLRRTLLVGGQTIANRGFVNAQNRVPVDPDDQAIVDVEVWEGQEIFLPVENTTAGALTYRARIEIEEAEVVDESW